MQIVNKIPPSKRGLTYTLAYGFIPKDKSNLGISRILICHYIKGGDSLFSVCGCDDEWQVMESRGVIPSPEYAIIYAMETWQIKCNNIILYSGNDGETIYNKPRTRYDRVHAQARKRIEQILREFKYLPRVFEQSKLNRKATFNRFKEKYGKK